MENREELGRRMGWIPPDCRVNCPCIVCDDILVQAIPHKSAQHAYNSPSLNRDTGISCVSPTSTPCPNKCNRTEREYTITQGREIPRYKRLDNFVLWRNLDRTKFHHPI
jgi:hypothetical protein